MSKATRTNSTRDRSDGPEAVDWYIRYSSTELATMLHEREEWALPQQETPPASLKLTGLPGNRDVQKSPCGNDSHGPFRIPNGGAGAVVQAGL
jgi:hypothetical protein